MKNLALLAALMGSVSPLALRDVGLEEDGAVDRARRHLCFSGGISLEKNIGEQVVFEQGVSPTTATAGTYNGASIDRLAHGGALSCLLHQSVGAVAGSPTAISVQTTLQHSADNTTFTNYINGAGVTQQTPAVTSTTGAQDTSVSVDLNGANRYIRPVTVVTFTGGTAPTVAVASDEVLAGERELPAV